MHLLESNGSGNLIAFIFKASQLHPPYAYTAQPQEVATEEVQVDG
jgi:hypothetical protein